MGRAAAGFVGELSWILLLLHACMRILVGGNAADDLQASVLADLPGRERTQTVQSRNEKTR